MDSEFIANGKTLGYVGEELKNYIILCRTEKEKDVNLQREIRAHEREMKKLEADIAEMNLKKIEVVTESSEQNNSIVGEQKGKSFIKLTPFQDGQDVAIYLQTFEKVKTANGWTDDVALTALQNGFVNSRVCSFMNSLKSGEPYKSVKTSIIKAFGHSVYDYQKKFRQSRQGDESFTRYALRVREYFEKFCDLANVGENFDNLVDVIIKDQLVNSVDKELSEYLRENELFNVDFDKMIKLADNFQSIHKSDSNNSGNYDSNVTTKTCYVCKRSGHSARNCKFNTSNFVSGPLSEATGNSNNLFVENRTCFKCNKKGHIARYCANTEEAGNANFVKIGVPNQSLNESFNVMSIAASGCQISVNQDLPVTYGKCNDKDAKILRDTGATVVLVRRSFIADNQFLGSVAKIRFADGRIITAPKVKLVLNCIFFKGETEGVCVDNLPFDVLLGNVPGARCACTEEPSDICAVQTRGQKLIENISKCDTKVNTNKVLFDLSALNTQELIALQKRDPKLKSYFLRAGIPDTNYPKFQFINGVLVRSTLKRKDSNDLVEQIMLPSDFVINIIKLAHDNIAAGHLGIRKTTKRILAHFFWPGCYDDIKKYCHSCELCQKFVANKPPKHPLIKMPVISKPFHRVAIDLIGPFAKSSNGNRFALVMIDLATKYPDAVPLKHIDSNTVSEALLDMFCRVGIPTEILHDQGAQFMSSVMRKFNQLLQIKSLRTSPYHPRCNGTCENFNKVLKTMMKKVASENPRIWDRYLQPLLFAYREVPQSSTGFSPFEMLFGYDVRGPLFLIKEKLLDIDGSNEDIPVTTFVISMREKLREYLKLSNAAENESKLKEKSYYDKNCRIRKFKPGDKVLLLLPTSTSKLLAEWRGPYEIVRKLNVVDYIVRVNNLEKTFHVNMLKIFRERVPNSNICSVDLIEENESNFDLNVCSELSVSQSERVVNAVRMYDTIFDSVPGRVNFMEYSIDVDPLVKPIHSLPYKIPFHLKDKVDEELDKWVKCGIARPSDSQWCFPVVIVQNSDSSLRITVDYRKLNKHVVTDPFPMPRMDTVIERLSGAKYITKLDLTKAFLQIPLTEDSKKYTSFVTDSGQYEFNVVPFGIKFASGICNRVIKEILKPCISFVDNFVDDLIVFSSNFEDHLQHVSLVLDRLSSAGLTLNRKKCSFANKRVKFLGVIVGEDKILPDIEKIDAIRNFPRPVVKKDLRSFLGLINFYRRFAPNLAMYVSPLNGLLKKCCPDKIVWNNEMVKYFNDSVKCMENSLPLFIPKPNDQFIIQTDACMTGLGAVLWQRCEEGDRPILFISRKVSDAEKNYPIIELECLAIKWAILMFHDYVYGRKFLVRTDHAPLQWLANNKNRTSRRMRWALTLQSYSFDVEYVKAKDNFLADILSRYPSSGNFS